MERYLGIVRSRGRYGAWRCLLTNLVSVTVPLTKVDFGQGLSAGPWVFLRDKAVTVQTANYYATTKVQNVTHDLMVRMVLPRVPILASFLGVVVVVPLVLLGILFRTIPRRVPLKHASRLHLGREICDCKCKSYPSKKSFPCHRSSICADSPLSMCDMDSKPCNLSCPTDETVMHCRESGGGSLLVRPRLQHVVALLRLSGPVIDTLQLRKMPKSCGLWAANYTVCGAGLHHATMSTLFEYSSRHHDEAVLLGSTCLVRQLLGKYTRFSWQEASPPTLSRSSSCRSLWHWPNFSTSNYTAQVEALSYIKNVESGLQAPTSPRKQLP